jgi:hypothetical protein
MMHEQKRSGESGNVAEYMQGRVVLTKAMEWRMGNMEERS